MGGFGSLVTLLLLATTACGGGGGGGGASSAHPPQGETTYSATYTNTGVEGGGCSESGQTGTTTEKVTRDGEGLSMFSGGRVGGANFFITLSGTVAGDGSFAMEGTGTSGGQSLTWTYDGSFSVDGWSGSRTMTWMSGGSRCVWSQTFTGSAR
jgi:hypothetical protein